MVLPDAELPFQMSSKEMIYQALPTLNQLLNEIQLESQYERSYHERKLEGQLIRYSELPPLEKQLKVQKIKLNNLLLDRVNLCSWSFTWLLAVCTCNKQRQLELLDRDIGKIKADLKEIQKEVDHVELSAANASQGNDNDYLEMRSLERHRDLVEDLLQPIFSQQQHQYITDWDLRIKETKYQQAELTKTNQMLLNVIELLEETIDYLKEGTFYALEHSGNLEETIKSFFPQEAIESFKKARELYPQLPKFKRPEPPATATPRIPSIYSTAASRYLTEVRQSVEEMEEQCRQTLADNTKAICEIEIEIGKQVDCFNLERVKLISQPI